MANEHVFRSAGIDAWTGQPASNHALAILASQYHVDAESHRAYRLNDELVAWADLIYTMTPERASQICERFPATGQKLKLLDERVPFEDPIGGSSEEYRQLAHLIETALMKHISQLEIL